MPVEYLHGFTGASTSGAGLELAARVCGCTHVEIALGSALIPLCTHIVVHTEHNFVTMVGPSAWLQ